MSFKLSQEDGEFLVRLARNAVREYLKDGKRIVVPTKISSKLVENCGVFVTLNRLNQGKKELRGCIGFPYPTAPLAKALIESAINSATQDPRFHPLSLNELSRIVFEVSVLTPPLIVRVEKPTDYPSKIKIGQDGLIIESGYHKGLLLPQVPIEWKWDEEDFLSQCCLKAGLSPDCWLLKETKIFNFSCIIAREISPGGDVEVTDMRSS